MNSLGPYLITGTVSTGAPAKACPVHVSHIKPLPGYTWVHLATPGYNWLRPGHILVKPAHTWSIGMQTAKQQSLHLCAGDTGIQTGHEPSLLIHDKCNTDNASSTTAVIAQHTSDWRGHSSKHT